MRTLIATGLLAAALSACGGGGGNAPSPYGGTNAPVAPAGGGAATATPKAAPVSSPLPSGTTNDPYGYGY